MELFFKTIAGILVAAILILALDKQTIGLLLTAVVCAMAAAAAVSYFDPVKELLLEIQALAELQDGLVSILMKCAGVGLVSEVAGLICQDAGLGSLQKTVQLLGNSVILCRSIPAFQTLLTLIKDILSEL